MDRDETNVVDIVNNIIAELNELKTDQVFGGDAIVANEFDAQLSNDASVIYSLTLTPANLDLGVLPSSLELRWTNTNMHSQSTTNYVVSQVYRSDGVFEWKIEGGHINDYDTYVTLQYIGDGMVELTRVD